MHDQVKKDILAVLNELLEILKVKEDQDILQIKELSNHVIHNASVFQDEDSISVAVLIYSLSKIIERKHGNIAYDGLLNMVNLCTANLKVNDDESFRKSIRNIFNISFLFIKSVLRTIVCTRLSSSAIELRLAYSSNNQSKSIPNIFFTFFFASSFPCTNNFPFL